MKKVLFTLLILNIFTLSISYAVVIDRAKEKEQKEQSQKQRKQYTEEFSNISDKKLLAELNKILDALPKNDDEIIKADVIIDIAGKRHLFSAKSTLKKMIDKYGMSTIDEMNLSEVAFVPRRAIKNYAKEALKRIELAEEFEKEKIVTKEQKADYMVQKLKKKELNIFVDEALPNIVPKLLLLLDEKDERLKENALILLEQCNDKSVQDRVMSLMEEEIKKPGYGLYFRGSFVLEKIGDKKAYEFLKGKLNDPNKYIRWGAGKSLVSFWERGIVTKDEAKKQLTPILTDKDKRVASMMRTHMRDSGLFTGEELSNLK